MAEPWYRNAIFYAVDVKTFQDSDCDGVGDFRGLESRVDYLAKLGISCVWLLPFFPSPGRDNGYDVTDYFAIDPRLGTLEDFIRFVHKAGEHGIRVLIDLVMNHTSDRHPWFEAGRRDPRSRYRDYYVWTEAPPKSPDGIQNIFVGEESTVWTHDPLAGAYYYHRFYSFEPDLHVANPAVREEIERVLDFWLSLGVAGFRFDAASHLIEAKGLDTAEPKDPHGVIKEFHRFVSHRRPDAALLGEADVPTEHVRSYFGDGDELNLLLNFILDNHVFLALATERAEPIERALARQPAIPDTGQWLNFLRNLDELDLERLTEEERGRVYDAFAPDEGMRIYGRGIRRRLAPMLEGNRRKLELAMSLLFSLPGAPLLVYGDELGMGEDLSLAGRDAVRTPMQWTSGDNGGFSGAESTALIRPVVSHGSFGYRRLNVEAELEDEGSFFHAVRRFITARHASPEVGSGRYHVLDSGDACVLAHALSGAEGEIVAVHNLSGSSRHVRLPLAGFQGGRAADVLAPERSQPIGRSSLELRLEPYAYRWLRVDGRHA